MRDEFWKRPLDQLNEVEWEALCDRCGKCCLIKLEDEDTGEVVYTSLACKLFDNEKCICSDYQNRKTLVPDCLSLTIDNIPESVHWLPETCAYVRRYYGFDLPKWHPLLKCGDSSMHEGGHSVKNRTQSEKAMLELEDALAFIDRSLGP